MIKKNKCLWCGKEFKYPRRTYCSHDCYVKFRNRHKTKMGYFKSHYRENDKYYKKRSAEWYKNHKEEVIANNLAYVNKRYKEDEAFRMRRLLGNSLRHIITHYIKTRRVANPMKEYRIDWRGIIKVLKPFPKPRSKYHVDHIIPLWKFDLTNWEQIRLAFAPENHRWMLTKDNLKRNKAD